MLASAVWQSHLVRMLYRRGDRGGIVERQIEPLGLVLKGGIWYLVARASTNIRTYRVSRVLEMTVLPEAFERPDDFDLAEHWDRSTTAYEDAADHVEVTVRSPSDRLAAFAGEVGSKLMASATPGPIRMYPATSGSPVAFDWIDAAVGVALRLGADVEVLEPVWLRRSIFDSATAIVERYAERSVAAGPV